MTNQNRFANISGRVLNALDKDFSGWQDLVPAEKDSELDEESLIQLIKNSKRAEIYRTIADKRNALMKEAYDGSDKSFLDLAQEFTTFSYEQTQKWAEMEGKLSSIWLEFKAKSEPTDLEGMSKSLDSVTQKMGENIDDSVSVFNTSMDNYLGSFFNTDANGVSRAGSDELKSFLKDKVNQFKEENREVGEKQKEFLNNSVKKLIKNKIEKIKAGELPSDALDRSDLFTDEEEGEIERLQAKVIIDAVKERKNSNVSAINEMSQKFMGVAGKENILKKLEECPEDIITEEVKKAISEAIDYGCILKSSEINQSTRKTRWVADAICIALDYAALKLAKLGDKEVAKSIEDTDSVYKFCNSGSYYTAHLFTFGFCSIWTAQVNIKRASEGKPVDWIGISNVLSGISFLVGLFSFRGTFKMFVKKMLPTVANIGCQVYAGFYKKEKLSTFCASALLIWNVAGATKSATITSLMANDLMSDLEVD